jgi:hypothetical protein
MLKLTLFALCVVCLQNPFAQDLRHLWMPDWMM